MQLLKQTQRRKKQIQFKIFFLCHWKTKTIFILSETSVYVKTASVCLRKSVCVFVLDPQSSRVLSSEPSSHMDHKQGDYQTGLG